LFEVVRIFIMMYQDQSFFPKTSLYMHKYQI